MAPFLIHITYNTLKNSWHVPLAIYSASSFTPAMAVWSLLAVVYDRQQQNCIIPVYVQVVHAARVHALHTQVHMQADTHYLTPPTLTVTSALRYVAL